MSNYSDQVMKTTRKNLLLAVVAGMCSNALLSSMTVSAISFSIFPLIALLLSVQMLYQNYLREPVSEDLPLVGLACFFIGAFGYSAYTKVQYPEAGSNFFAIIVTLLLLLLVSNKLSAMSKDK